MPLDDAGAATVESKPGSVSVRFERDGLAPFTCAEFGIPFEREQLYQYGGIPTRKIIAMLAEQQGLTVDVEAFTRRKIALYMTHIDKVSVFPKMWELVRHYHGKVKMGIGTGSPRSRP